MDLILIEVLEDMKFFSRWIGLTEEFIWGYNDRLECHVGI